MVLQLQQIKLEPTFFLKLLYSKQYIFLFVGALNVLWKWLCSFFSFTPDDDFCWTRVDQNNSMMIVLNTFFASRNVNINKCSDRSKEKDVLR